MDSYFMSIFNSSDSKASLFYRGGAEGCGTKKGLKKLKILFIKILKKCNIRISTTTPWSASTISSSSFKFL